MIGLGHPYHAGIHDAQPPSQHMVELDERADQPAPLRPGTHPALTSGAVGIGHRLGDRAISRVAPRRVEVPGQHEGLARRLPFPPGLQISQAGPPVRSPGQRRRQGVDRTEQDIIAGVLEQFPRLKTLLDRAGGALSGGEQQLLAIARCLCGNPRLVLLDEPTEGIQPSIIDEIVETLQRLRATSGLTMILVEQNLDFIAALSQRILIIQKGTITREVQPGDLADASLVGEFVGIAT